MLDPQKQSCTSDALCVYTGRGGHACSEPGKGSKDEAHVSQVKDLGREPAVSHGKISRF